MVDVTQNMMQECVFIFLELAQFRDAIFGRVREARWEFSKYTLEPEKAAFLGRPTKYTQLSAIFCVMQIRQGHK